MLFSSEVTEEMVSLVDEIFKARLEKNKAEVSKKTTMLEVQQSKSEMIRLGWISKSVVVFILTLLTYQKGFTFGQKLRYGIDLSFLVLGCCFGL